MTQINIGILSIILQLLAALLALRLIRLTHHRAAWICITAALVLMIARRIFTLVPVYASKDPISWNLYDFTGLVVSAVMLVGLIYMRQYLDDTFAAERRLQDSEKRYRTLAQNIPKSAVFLFDRDHRYTLAEGPLLQQMGFPREQFEGKNLLECSLPDELTELFASIQESALNGTPTTTEQPYKTGTFSVQCIPIENAGGTIASGMAVVLDITEQKKTEQERNAAYEFLQHTIDGVAEPVMVIGLDYQVKLMNRVIRENYVSDITSAPRVCYALSHHRDAPCNDTSHPCPLQQVRATLMPSTVLHEHVTAHGEIRQVEILASPLFNEHGQLQGIIEASRDITERKQAEKALQNSERRFRALIENGVDYISLMSADGRLLWESPSTSRILGYAENEFLGQNTLELVHPDDLGWLGEKLVPLISMPGAQDRASFRLRHHDGSWRWVEAVVTNLINESNVEAIVINYHDITERKQAEAEKNKLLSAIEYAVDGIAITDEHDQYIYVNEAHASIYGYSQDELIGKTWKCLVPKESQESLENTPNEMLRDKQMGSFISERPALRKDGSQIPTEVRAKALWGNDGQYAGHICIVVDITKRKQAEQAINRRAEELEALVRVSAAMRAAQSQGAILSAVLSQVAELFHTVGAALGTYDASMENVVIQEGCGAWKNWRGRCQPISNRITNKVFLTGQPHVTKELSSDQIIEGPADIRNIPCVVCVPITTNLRKVGVLWLGCQNVISEKDLALLNAIADMVANALQRQALHEDLQAKLKDLQEAQAHIIQSEKLAAIGQLTSGIAHELNNPLTSVLLYSQMMQRRSVDDNAKHDLDNIVAETLRASKIVRGLLDFARQRSPERRAENINDIMKGVVDLASYELRAHNIQCELELHNDVPITLVDAHQLQQVFINLVNNAWQAISETRKKGNLRIKTELSPSHNRNNLNDNSPVIRISIEDDGPGIPTEYLSKVFDPFFTTKPEGRGTGLGLSICHGIISEHGGNIWVESEFGKGSKFIVELPVISPEGIHNTRDTDLPVKKAPGNSRLLIIDDERSVLEVLARALRSKGYQVDAVSCAEDGLEKMEQVDYSAILCDVRMPGIGGPDLYNEVYARNPELVQRIVFISGGAASTKTQTLIRDKNILCLTKPFELDELYKTIQLIENDLARETNNSSQSPQF